MKKAIVSALLLSLPSVLLAEEGIMYVQSKVAKLLAQPAFKAEEIATLKKGSSVTVIRAEGRWIEVNAADKQGWISKFLLADNPPINKVTVLPGSGESKLEESARRRASAVTTAGAARGLSNEDRLRENDSVSVNYRALEQMETKVVGENEARSFLSEGMAQ